MEYHTIIDSNKYPLLHMQLEYGQLRNNLADIRCLLRLPQKRLPAGCNYTAASSLFNLIGGISICFFDASLKKFNSNSERGRALRDLLSLYYPWQEEPLSISKKQAIDVLYDSVRNPLTHSLGLYRASEHNRIYISKSKLTTSQIARLENPIARPMHLPPTISNTPPAQYRLYAVELALNIPSLYWGVNRLLYLLLSDSSQSERTEQFFRDLSSKYNQLSKQSSD